MVVTVEQGGDGSAVGRDDGAGGIVAHVARRHGVPESCLYTWCRQLVDGMADPQPYDDAPLLIPVTVDTGPA